MKERGEKSVMRRVERINNNCLLKIKSTNFNKIYKKMTIGIKFV